MEKVHVLSRGKYVQGDNPSTGVSGVYGNKEDARLAMIEGAFEDFLSYHELSDEDMGFDLRKGVSGEYSTEEIIDIFDKDDLVTMWDDRIEIVAGSFEYVRAIHQEELK